MDAVEEMADELVRRILSAEHAYAESTLLSTDQLRGACLANITEMIGDLAGERPVDLDAARQRRGQQRRIVQPNQDK